MKKLLIILMIFTYSFITVLGPFSFHYEHEDVGIMGPDCHHEVCLNVLNDINIWHDLLFTFLPIVKIFLSVLLISIFVFYIDLVKVFFIGLSNVYSTKYREDYYQSLFSDGLLNPKSP